jgi:hypothetical protein
MVVAMSPLRVRMSWLVSVILDSKGWKEWVQRVGRAKDARDSQA